MRFLSSKSKERKVVFVTQVMPHYRAGVFEFIQAELGEQVVWITGRSTSDGKLRELDHSLFPRTRFVRNHWCGHFLWQSGLWQALRAESPTVVVFTGDVRFLSTWCVAAYLRLFTGVRVLYWTMGWRKKDEGVVRLVRNSFYRLAHGLLLYGNIGRRAGVESGYPAARMHLIYNSLPDVEKPVGEWKTDLSAVESKTWTFGAVARLNANKRFDLLIEAVAELNGRGHRARVLLAGAGPEEDALRTLAAERNVECVLFGSVYGEPGLTSVYEQLDVTVVPGAIGLTAIQSLQFGTPVVTSDDMAIQGPEVEAVTSELGTLVSDMDAERLSAELEKWILEGERIDPVACRLEYESKWSPAASGRRILAALE